MLTLRKYNATAEKASKQATDMRKTILGFARYCTAANRNNKKKQCAQHIPKEQKLA